MDDVRTLKALQLDALREVANIGAGHAATALSQMINSTIMISVPTINVSRLEEVPPQVSAPEEPVAAVLHRLGDTLTPLALFSVGLVFQFGALKGRTTHLLVGLAWKLVLAPLVALGVALTAGLSGMPVIVGVLQAAQGPMITAGILAQEHRLDPELVSLVVGLGILLSFVTAPLWFLLIRG